MIQNEASFSKIACHIKVQASLFLALIIGSTSSFAQQAAPLQTKPFELGIITQLESQYLGETRVLNLYFPQGYDPDSAETYPVIYLLDGSAHEDYLHVVGIVQFMNMYELLPKSIVVGIANVDRYRDFTHPTQSAEDLESLPTAGGSAAFLDFLEKELQPFIVQHYPTNGHRTLIGQSLGGLLATEVLLTRPHIFEDYIIVSPSLWWNEQSLVNSADSCLQAHPGHNKQVFVSLGKEHPVMHEVADKLVAAIQAVDSEHFTLFYEPILQEDHATILHRAVYKAFQLLNPKSDTK